MTVFVLLCVGLLQTAQIGIIDLDSTGASKLIDKSDEGESIEGLSSFFVGFRLSYRESNIGDAWDGSHGGYLTKGTAGFVLWALSGYAPGQPVNIYAHWHFQRNETLADYQVNSWPERIQKKHFESPATNDLVLVDGRSETCYFEKLGCYCADEGDGSRSS